MRRATASSPTRCSNAWAKDLSIRALLKGPSDPRVQSLLLGQAHDNNRLVLILIDDNAQLASVLLGHEGHDVLAVHLGFLRPAIRPDVPDVVGHDLLELVWGGHRYEMLASRAGS